MEMQRSLGSIEGKLDTFITQSKLDREVDAKERAELQHRVSKLESWRTFLIGAWTVLAALGGIMLKVVL